MPPEVGIDENSLGRELIGIGVWARSAGVGLSDRITPDGYASIFDRLGMGDQLRHSRSAGGIFTPLRAATSS